MNTAEEYNELYINTPDRWAGTFDIDVKIKEIIDEAGKKDIIDLGCGIGRTINVIKNDKLNIIGVDFSSEGLKIAKKINPEIIFMECDMRDVPIISNFFDIVLSVGSHEHITPIDFSEVVRLLKPDGMFICVLPVAKSDIGLEDISGQIEWKLTRDSWIKHLESFGLKLIDHKYNEGVFFICHI